MSILEKLKALFDAADQGKWTALGRFHSIAFGVSESDEAIGEVFGIGPKADANINLICQTQNMMPEILAEVERLQWLEAELQRVRGRANVLESTLHSSIEVMQIMREQIDQFQSMFDDEDGPIESACPEHDDIKKKIAQVIE